MAIGWLAVAMCVAGSALPRAARAQATFMGLGNLPGATSGFVGDVSADGTVVVGISGGQAFRWTGATGLVGLGVLPGRTFSNAQGVSADGSVVVGTSGAEAFRWTAATGMVGLGNIPGGGIFESGANDVSADGSVVVGFGSFDQPEPSRWTMASGMVPLGPLPGASSAGGEAFAVSADGSVAGGQARPSGFLSDVAFRWTEAGGLVALSELPSTVRGISADGSVMVGGVRAVGRNDEAFRWTEADGLMRLGDLPGGDFRSVALDVSDDASVIVGQGGSASGSEAFIWDADGGMQSLPDLLEALGADLAGWQLFSATAISADGRTIVGTGINPGGQREPWIAVLPPLVPDCGDGLDNDDDGLADLADPGCTSAADASEQEASLVCDNGNDDDGDRFADHPADPGCASLTDDSEHDASLVCDDGADNDGDGFFDHPADLGCSDPSDASESVEAGFMGLGDLPGGAFSSNAYGISGDGRVVVGSSESDSGAMAFRWTSAGGMEELDLLDSEARGASADGATIVGVSQETAFRWDGGTLTFLPLESQGEPRTGWANAVSADGVTVVGAAERFPDSFPLLTHPIAWSGDTVTTALTERWGIGSETLAVSADGSVFVGTALNEPGDLQAFRYAGGVFQFLRTSTFFSSANAVSADGSVVAGRTLVQTQSFNGIAAFRWTQTGGAEILTQTLCCGLGEEPVLSQALGMSADGATIVGSMGQMGQPQEQAMIWTEQTGVIPLRQRLEQAGVPSPFAGWTRTVARAVSANGLVAVGDGLNPSGQREAWIAVLPEPTDEPACSDGLDNDLDGFFDFPADPGCVSPEARSEIRTDLDFDGTVDLWLDRLAFAATFGLGEGDPGFVPEADFDGDGQITIVDFQIWFAIAAGGTLRISSSCGLLGIEVLGLVWWMHLVRVRGMRRRMR